MNPQGTIQPHARNAREALIRFVVIAHERLVAEAITSRALAQTTKAIVRMHRSERRLDARVGGEIGVS